MSHACAGTSSAAAQGCGVKHRACALAVALAITAAPFLVVGCLTASQEAKIGQDQSKRVEQTLGLVSDAALERYVRSVGERLAARSTRPEGPWQFLVVDTPEPNAFALPGGYVYVTRGLLALVNSDDELAGVLGHEIGHVTDRHGSKRLGAAVVTAPISIATGLAGFAVSIVSPMLGNLVAGTGAVLTGGLVLAPFSREQEHRADQIGLGLAAAAGYDPAGMPTFLRTLDGELALLSGQERAFHFLDTHPMTPDRIERTAQLAAELSAKAAHPVTRDRAALLAALDGLVLGEDPAQGVMKDQVFMHPEFGIAIDFPVGWKISNTPSAVGAISPGEDAMVALQLAASDTSLAATLDQIQREQSDVRFERFEIRGQPAARTVVRGRGETAVIVLIEYQRNVYSVLGQSADRTAEQYARVFEATANSFRALRASERNAIRETRLRIRPARAGETPAELTRRTGSVWPVERLALANGVGEDATFSKGYEVKVALQEPYSSRSR